MPVHSLSKNFQFSSNWQWNHSPKIQKQPTPPSLTIAFFLVWPPRRHGPSHRDTTKTSLWWYAQLYGTIASDTVVPFPPFLRSIAPRCDVTSVPSKIPRRTFARFFISPKPHPHPLLRRRRSRSSRHQGAPSPVCYRWRWLEVVIIIGINPFTGARACRPRRIDILRRRFRCLETAQPERKSFNLKPGEPASTAASNNDRMGTRAPAVDHRWGEQHSR